MLWDFEQNPIIFNNYTREDFDNRKKKLTNGINVVNNDNVVNDVNDDNFIKIDVIVKLTDNEDLYKIIMSFVEDLDEDNIKIKTIQYYTSVEMIGKESEEVVIMIKSILEKHGWNWFTDLGPRGFNKEPNIMFLINDLQEIIDKYT